MSWHKRHSLRATAEDLVKEAMQDYESATSSASAINGDDVQLVSSRPLSEVPALETFAKRIDRRDAIDKWHSDVRVGDELVVKVRRADAAGAHVRPLCTGRRLKRDLEWLEMEMVIPVSPLARRLNPGDRIRVFVEAANPLRIAPVTQANAGALRDDDLPAYFRIGREYAGETSMDAFLAKHPLQKNHYVDGMMGMPTKSPFSFLSLAGLDRARANPASALRATQLRKLAMGAVESGVTAMREGNCVAAMQHLQRAIQIDEQCADAHVAMGAAHANMKLFGLAHDSLQQALRLDPNHKNARSYLATVYIAWAEQCEEEGNVESAMDKLERSLSYVDDERARDAMERLRRKQKDASPEVVEVKESSEGKKRRKSSAGSEGSSEKKRAREAAEKKREAETHTKKKKSSAADKEKLKEMEAFIAALKGK